MKAISIRQPWAWAIVRPDITNALARAGMLRLDLLKTIENRDWPTNFRGPLAIHAAKKWDENGFEWICAHVPAIEKALRAQKEGIAKGGIVGRAIVADCVTQHRSRWFLGTYGLVLEAIEPLPFVPCRGQLGLFEVPGIALPEGVPLPPAAFEEPEHRRERTL